MKKTIASLILLAALSAGAQQLPLSSITNVNTGTYPNSGTGDPAYTAFDKDNTNTTVLSNNVAAIEGGTAPVGNAQMWGGISTNALSSQFNMTFINNTNWTEVWLSTMLPRSSGQYAVTSWGGIHGNFLTGTATYDPSVANGNPIIDGFTGNNVLTNFAILGRQYTNCGSLVVAFWCPRPATPPGNLQILLNASYNNNNDYFTLSPHGQESSGMEIFNDTWNDSAGTRGGTLMVDGNPQDCIHIYSAMWTNGVFQDFIDGKVINNYPNGAYYQTFSTPVQLAGSLYVGNNYNLTTPLTVGGIYAIAISTNYVGLQVENQAVVSIKNNIGINRPTVNLIGDSMWHSISGWGQTILDYLAPSFPGWTIDDCGVPGATSAQVLSNQLYMAQVENTGQKTLDYFWCNGNNDGTTISSVLGPYTNNLMLMSQSAVSNGCVPVAVIPPSNPYTDSTGLRFALDGWFVTNGQSYFVSSANLGIYPTVWQLNDYVIGYSNDCTNAIYFSGGGPHLTNSGNADAVIRLAAVGWYASAPTTNVNAMNVIGNLSFASTLAFDSTNFTFYMDGGAYPSMWMNTVLNDTFYGTFSGALITGGIDDVGVGEDALNLETSGSGETAVGQTALADVVGGTRNTAVGNGAFGEMTGGSYNVGVGEGVEAFFTGTLNDQTAIGYNAGLDIEGGNGGDTYLGFDAGSVVTNSSSNIEIGNTGLPGDGNITRIGTSDTNTFLSSFSLIQATNSTGALPAAITGCVIWTWLTGTNWWITTSSTTHYP